MSFRPSAFLHLGQSSWCAPHSTQSRLLQLWVAFDMRAQGSLVLIMIEEYRYWDKGSDDDCVREHCGMRADESCVQNWVHLFTKANVVVFSRASNKSNSLWLSVFWSRWWWWQSLLSYSKVSVNRKTICTLQCPSYMETPSIRASEISMIGTCGKAKVLVPSRQMYLHKAPDAYHHICLVFIVKHITVTVWHLT